MNPLSGKLDLLRSKTLKKQCEGLQEIGYRQDPVDIPYVQEVLETASSDEIISYSLLALQSARYNGPLDQIVPYLRNDNYNIRTAALYCIAASGREDAKQILLKEWDDCFRLLKKSKEDDRSTYGGPDAHSLHLVILNAMRNAACPEFVAPVINSIYNLDDKKGEAISNLLAVYARLMYLSYASGINLFRDVLIKRKKIFSKDGPEKKTLILKSLCTIGTDEAKELMEDVLSAEKDTFTSEVIKLEIDHYWPEYKRMNQLLADFNMERAQHPLENNPERSGFYILTYELFQVNLPVKKIDIIEGPKVNNLNHPERFIWKRKYCPPDYFTCGSWGDYFSPKVAAVLSDFNPDIEFTDVPMDPAPKTGLTDTWTFKKIAMDAFEQDIRNPRETLRDRWDMSDAIFLDAAKLSTLPEVFNLSGLKLCVGEKTARRIADIVPDGIAFQYLPCR